MKFTKMHGLGNDYIYVNCLEHEINNPSEVSKIVSDRHFGIGSDGLVLILPSDIADFRMRMYNPHHADYRMRIFNSDGSEAEMCGNAIRCVGKYLYDNGITQKTILKIETLAGIRVLEMSIVDNEVDCVRVDMGEPVINTKDIPVLTEKEEFISEPVEIDGVTYNVTCVSMGNPHAVTYVDDLKNFPLETVGPKMEHFILFPKKINAEFVKIIDRNTLEMRVWERGSGETLACGTGACAVLVASVLNGASERKAIIKLRGGDLLIEWNESDNHVYMTGPAVKVFEGEIEI